MYYVGKERVTRSFLNIRRGERKMKKSIYFIGLAILISIFMIPTGVLAEDLDLSIYHSETLQEAFQKENITYDFSNYQETSDMVPIYLFRLDGCGNCKGFLNFVANDLLVNHSEKFKIISYEMRNDPINIGLRTKVQNFLGESVDVTPYIIIGDKTFSGYIDSTKQTQIKEAIISLYNSNDKYDVFEDMQDNKKVFSDAGITFTSKKGIDKNYTLKASAIDKSNVKLDDEYNYVTAYDITMYNGATVVPMSNGSFEIRIPVSTKYDMYKVGYINNGNIDEVLDATYDNGYVVFTTTHLSEYAVYGMNHKDINASVTTGNTVSEKNPNTLDNIQIYEFLLGLGLVSFAGSLLVLKKKKMM